MKKKGQLIGGDYFVWLLIALAAFIIMTFFYLALSGKLESAAEFLQNLRRSRG